MKNNKKRDQKIIDYLIGKGSFENLINQDMVDYGGELIREKYGAKTPQEYLDIWSKLGNIKSDFLPQFEPYSKNTGDYWIKNPTILGTHSIFPTKKSVIKIKGLEGGNNLSNQDLSTLRHEFEHVQDWNARGKDWKQTETPHHIRYDDDRPFEFLYPLQLKAKDLLEQNQRLNNGIYPLLFDKIHPKNIIQYSTVNPWEGQT